MRIIDEITYVRDKLNKTIIESGDYDQIYRLSLQLDDLIALFYKMERDYEQKNRVS